MIDILTGKIEGQYLLYEIAVVIRRLAEEIPVPVQVNLVSNRS